MPHSTLKLQPGVDQNKTLALNEAAISVTNLVRFIPDRNNLGLVQKLGGWTRFFPTSIGSIVRALWAWDDTNSISHLAVGCEATSVSGNALSVITNGVRAVITPKTTTDNITISSPTAGFSTTIGSSTVNVHAPSSNLDSLDSVYFQTQVSVGGLILFGTYAVTAVDANNFSITAVDALGNPKNATSAVTDGGAVPTFTTTNNSPFVTVTLADHGYSVGDTFPVLISTTVGGITFLGNYLVTAVSSSSQFVITASNSATSSAGPTGMNGGQARLLYYNTPGPPATSTGYGVGGYGAGGYGTGVTPPVGNTGTPIDATDWTLDNWGEVLIACPVGKEIYQWSPSSGTTTASIITNAPSVNDGMFVAMPQRQIIAWGSTFTGVQDPLLIRWCDVNNYDDWIAQITNQAGSYRLPKGSKIVACIQGPQQGLVWTDLSVWAMQYVGPPFVYQFNEIGTGCGLIGRKAAGSMNGIVYWMGQSQFFRLGANGVEPIRCPIWDVIFQDLDTNNLDKIRIAPNSRFGEIAWYYPTVSNGGEVSHYVKYNILIDQWDFGELARTAWINESVFGPPIGAGANQIIYQHETSQNADGEALNASFQTGYFVISDGEYKTFVDQVWPDMKWGYYGGSQNASVLLTFYVTDYPGDTPTTYGPFTLTQATEFVTPRFRGRLMSIGIQSNDVNSFWRIGAMRYRFQQDGKF